MAEVTDVLGYGNSGTKTSGQGQGDFTEQDAAALIDKTLESVGTASNSEQDALHKPNLINGIPDYLIGIGNHDLVSGDPSMLDTTPLIHGAGGAIAGAIAGAEVGSAFGPWGTIGGAIVGGVTGYDWRFTAATVVSGVSQLSNSVKSIANVLPGVDMQTDPTETTHAVLKGYDDNLDRYYTDHQAAVDTAGFVAGSLIPGTVGMKIYNRGAAALDMAMTGAIGRNMEGATGLLGGLQKSLLAEAQATMTTSGAGFSFMNAKIVQSIAAGAGEQALQAVAFEAGVQIMMNKSPLLDGQDNQDIAGNLLHAALFGGALGGVVEGAVTAASTKKLLGGVDLSTIKNRWQSGVAEATPFDEKVLANLESRFALQTTAPEGATPEVAAFAARQQVATNNKISDEIGIAFQEVAKGDNILANGIHEIVMAEPDMLSASKLVLGLEDISRVNVQSPIEKEMAKLAKDVELGITLKPEQQAVLDNYSTKYLQLWGEGRGSVMPTMQGFKSVWDTLRKGEQVVIKPNEVLAGGKGYKIEMNKVFNMSTATNEDIAAVNARELWAIHSSSLPDGHTVGEYDLPLLRKAARDLADPESGVNIIRVASAKGLGTSVLHSQEDALALLDHNIGELRDHFVARGLRSNAGDPTKLSDQAIASILNTKIGYLKGTTVDTADHWADIHAIESYAKEYADATIGKVKSAFAANPDSVLLRPQVAKLIINTGKVNAYEATALPITVYMKEQQKLWQDTAERAIAPIMGSYLEQLPAHSELPIQYANRNQIGGSVISSANSSYGTVGSYFERIGHVVNKLKTELTNKVITQWDPVSYKLLGDTASTTELSIIMNKIRSAPDRYIFDPTGAGLIHQDYARYLQEIAAGEQNVRPVRLIDPKAEMTIAVNSPRTMEVLKTHTAMRAEVINKSNGIRSLSGPGDTRDPTVLYFPPPDTRDYPFFALVSDPSITSTGHIKMIHAASAEMLEKQIALVPEEFQAGIIRAPIVKTGPEVERWHKAIGDYKAQEVMSDSYFDAALYKSGAASPYILKTDPKLIIKELRDFHIAEQHRLLREAVSVKYAKEFTELKNLGDKEANISLSSFSAKSAAKYAKERADNPYMSYIRTALDLGNTEKIPMRAFQNYLDERISKVWDTFVNATARSTSVADLDTINKMVQDAGIKTINYDAINIALANHTMPRGALSTFTRRANAILTSLVLKPSVLNAVNNIVGMLVLLGPETRNVIESINKGSADAVGALAELHSITIPGSAPGTNTFMSTAKVVAKAVKDFHVPANRDWLLARGISVRHSQEVSDIVDTLALTGRENTLDLEDRITLAYNKLMKAGKWVEKKTGNSYAEEFTRGVSALVMKNYTDIAVAHELMSPQLAESYIQTFVNRVNGNYLASQRPMMFNGAIGQSVGLFQTYMVNFLQQSMRHVTEGSYKSLALMTGLQGTIYGMSGLPGFQQLNTNLVGSFAGNSDHKDVFSVMYQAMDKNMADWAMYGALSNTLGLLHPDLKLNMYVRGDLNPRNVSIVPINPLDYPIATASAKFFGNLYNTFDQIYLKKAAPGTSLLRGLEHNGVNRELSGLAQVLEAFTNPALKSYSTTSSGSLIAANDIFSVMTLARLSGAKPLDDAKAQDYAFRQVVYNAKEHDRIQELGSVIKSKSVAGQPISPQDIMKFQHEYVKIGGKQENFNKFFMGVYRESNVSQSNILSRNLKSYESQQMQLLMGGRKQNDFTLPDPQEQ